MPQPELTSHELEEIKKDRKLRVKLATSNLGWFCHLYLGHYITNSTPDFHWQIYRDLSDDTIPFEVIIGFRGSAKSTLASLALPLWASVTGRKKFIVPISDSYPQAKLIIANIIHELEDNEQLAKDFGPFKAKEEWTTTNVVFNNGTRIFARSKGQKIRGLRHQQYRPDLIICDDIENVEEVRTLEQRNKTEEWFLSDVFPALDTGAGKLVVVGSLLHSDSLISRLRKQILEHKTGLFREYPIIFEGTPLWPSRFDVDAIEQLKHNFGTRFFLREHLLQLVPDEGQVVKRVAYYDQLPELQRISIGVDLAISKDQTADYTAINVAGEGVDNKIYNIKCVYGRWNFNEGIEKVKEIYDECQRIYPNKTILLGIEDVAFQKAAIEEFYRRYHIQPTPIPQTKDKKARIETFLPYLENDQILFRREGLEDLIIQLLGVGIEAHDDCVDAAEISWRMVVNFARPEIQWL